MPIVTSTATIAAAADETFGTDDQAPLLSDWRNTWTFVRIPLQWGRSVVKFQFLWDTVHLIFRNLSPTIPATAKILSVNLRGVAAATSVAASFFTLILVLAKDGRWDPASVGPSWSKAGRDVPFDLDIRLRSTGGGTIVDTTVPPQSTNRPWPMKDVANRSARLGQSLIVATAGSLGFADWYLSRTSTAPINNIWCELWSQDGDEFPLALLATSTIRAASAPNPTTGAVFTFTFPLGQQPALSAGQKVVAVLRGNYPIGPANVRVHHNTSVSDFYSDGGFMVFAIVSFALDDHHYPMISDVQAIPTGSSTFAVWTPPQFVAGVSYDTPDLADLFQQLIRSGTYVEGDPVAFGLFRSDAFFPPGNVTRQWADFGHPTYGPVQLIVEWRRRNRQVI